MYNPLPMSPVYTKGRGVVTSFCFTKPNNASYSRQPRWQDWPANSVWWRVAELLSQNFGPTGLQLLHACLLVLVSLSKNSLLRRQFLALLKGALS